MSRSASKSDASAGDDLLTVADIAKHCQVSQRTVRRWIDNGSLKAGRLGRLRRIRRSDFEKFLKQNS